MGSVKFSDFPVQKLITRVVKGKVIVPSPCKLLNTNFKNSHQIIFCKDFITPAYTVQSYTILFFYMSRVSDDLPVSREV